MTIIDLPEIEYGPCEGPGFSSDHISELTRLVTRLHFMVPGALNWKIWYDATEDYHCLSFHWNHDNYLIRYYKAFSLTKNQDPDDSITGEYRIFSCLAAVISYFSRQAKNTQLLPQRPIF
jgi:hypothetical protein